ncbi:MAG: hypothetical protein FJ116_08710 [Deltaproteobacteria bacterium]|nr:hypothetical protein [Deltaproteobacteria bacterium]
MKLVASLYSWALTLVASTVIGSIVSVIYPAIAFSASKTINLGEFKWADTLREYKIRKVNICGNADIQVTKGSIGKDFLIGNPKTGYLFSGLITHEDYWKTLESYDLEKAKADLKNRFNMAPNPQQAKRCRPGRMLFRLHSGGRPRWNTSVLVWPGDLLHDCAVTVISSRAAADGGEPSSSET